MFQMSLRLSTKLLIIIKSRWAHLVDFGFCPECGKIRENRKLPFCQSCYEFYSADLANIKTFLKENPGASALDIVKATEVKIERILYFIREGVIKIKK